VHVVVNCTHNYSFTVIMEKLYKIAIYTTEVYYGIFELYIGCSGQEIQTLELGSNE